MNKSLKLVVNNSFKIEDKKNFFEKKELEIILNLYAKMVSNGSWKDYGLSISSRQVSFSVFKNAADNYTYRGRNSSKSFYFVKYMNLLFLETIGAQTKGAKLDELARVIVRYAMSNTDISTFFIKVS